MRALRRRGSPGRLLSLRERIRDGYVQVALWRDGQRTWFRLHRLVLLVFVGPAPEGHEAAHREPDRADCRLSNLKWELVEINRSQTSRFTRLDWMDVADLDV